MSASTGPSHRSPIDPPSGLLLSRFISTLDWAKNTHELHADSGSSVTCVACAPDTHDSTGDDIGGAVDRLQGLAGFRVGREHMLAFSPKSAARRSLTFVPAVLSVDDGLLRCALQISGDLPDHCLTLDVEKITQAPALLNSDTHFGLEMTFPFVSLLFVKLRNKECKGATRKAPPEEASVDAHFGAVRDAIAELREGPSSVDQMVSAENDDSKEATFCSSYSKILRQKRATGACGRISEHKNGEAFTRFLARGAAMTMPICFPYSPVEQRSDDLSVDQGNHMEFVEAFEEQELAREVAMKDANRWVTMATVATSAGEDTMLSKAEVAARRAEKQKSNPTVV